jgi:hypothetical protein
VLFEQGIYFINPKATPPVDVTKWERRETRESPGGRFVFATLGFGIPPGIATVQQEWRDAPAALLNAGMPALAESSSPRPTIAFFSFATGRTTQIAALEKEPAWSGTGLTVSPDGRWILYVQMDQVVSDVMLVENFR